MRWLEVYAAHYGYALVEEDTRAWKMALAGVHPDDLEAAFLLTMKELKDREGVAIRPRAGDVLARVVAKHRGQGRVVYIIPTRPGDCFQRESPQDLGPRGDTTYACGCREHAPHLYCHHDDCRQLGVLNDEGRRLEWCRDHARFHDPEIKAAQQAKGELMSKIDELAKSKSMHTEAEGGDVEEVRIP